jgi:hypothetical protein
VISRWFAQRARLLGPDDYHEAEIAATISPTLLELTETQIVHRKLLGLVALGYNDVEHEGASFSSNPRSASFVIDQCRSAGAVQIQKAAVAQ